MTELDDFCRAQRGVISRDQALAAGLSPTALRHRLSSGRWQRLFLGTYAAFSGAVPRSAWRWAAVLRAGRDAVLTHRSAAEEIALAEEFGGIVHVAIPAERRVTSCPGLRVRRSVHIAARRHPTRSPPQTRAEETVLDLAISAGSPDEAMNWITSACGRRLTTPERLTAALCARERVSHRNEIRLLIGDVDQGVRSFLEDRYLRAVERAHGLPAGIRQDARPRPGGTWYDDVRYPAYRVIVELDGMAAHPDEQRWLDRRRDNAAVQAGQVVLRYGPADLSQRPCEVASQVAEVLRAAGWGDDAHPCGAGCVFEFGLGA